MPRLAPAAAQLADQVFVINTNMKCSPHGEVDGFGRFRAIEFDARTSKWLVPALEAIQDERISHIDYEGKGKAQIFFVPTVKADHRDTYPLATTLRVLRGED
jgi:hypothetical protein